MIYKVKSTAPLPPNIGSYSHGSRRHSERAAGSPPAGSRRREWPRLAGTPTYAT